jgi:hypothetical protein
MKLSASSSPSAQRDEGEVDRGAAARRRGFPQPSPRQPDIPTAEEETPSVRLRGQLPLWGSNWRSEPYFPSGAVIGRASFHL